VARAVKRKVLDKALMSEAELAELIRRGWRRWPRSLAARCPAGDPSRPRQVPAQPGTARQSCRHL